MEPMRDADDLHEWWIAKAEEEITDLTPKAKRYGALDLDVIGFTLCQMLKMNDLGRGERQEMACHFYLLGKVARMASAYQAGQIPDEDTLKDTGIYARMMQRIREKGHWP